MSSQPSSILKQPTPELLDEAFLFLLILGLAAYLRLYHGASTPGWYADEGTHIDIARHLAQGEVRYMALGESTLLFAKLPLFDWLLALLFRFTHVGIGPLRALTGTLGVISVAITYGVVRTIRRKGPLALLAALLLAIYPQAVIYSRLGFSYNLLTPLVLLVYLGLCFYTKTTLPTSDRRYWLALSALLIGLGALCDLWMFALVAPLTVAVLMRRPRHLLWTIPLTLLPWAIFASWMLWAAPQALFFDLAYLSTRLNKASLPQQLITLARNYTVLTSQDHWIALALVGMVLMRPTRWQRVTLICFFLPIVVIGRSEALYSVSAYTMIPLLPFVALGVAVLLLMGLPIVWQGMEQALTKSLGRWSWWEVRPERIAIQSTLSWGGALLLTGTLVGTPFLVTTIDTFQQTATSLPTKIDPFLINPVDAYAVAAFVNPQLEPDDLVIASPGLAWLFAANVADFQMGFAYQGIATPHLPANIPHERFRFDPTYTRARFVVVDNLWHTWAIYHVPGVVGLLEELKEWPLVAESGAIQVYCNPQQYMCASQR